MRNVIIYVLTSIVLFVALICMAVIGGDLFDGTGILIGLALMASLILFCLFLFLQNRKLCLWYSIACLLFAVNTFIVSHDPFMEPLSATGRNIVIRLEYISMLGFLGFIWLYINTIFNKGLNRFVLVCAVLIPGIYSAVVLLTPVAVFTQILTFAEAAILLSAVLIIFNMVWLVRKSSGSQAVQYILVVCVTTILTGLNLTDVFFSQTPLFDQGMNLTQIGMMLFLFINALVIILNLNHTETELNTAKEKEREISETNQLLARLNSLKSEFLANISHEMKTPLTVIGGYAKLTKRQIEANMTNEKTLENLQTVFLETQRLAGLVDKLLHMSIAEAEQKTNIRVAVDEIINKAAEMCGPILETNRNRLAIHIEKDCPPVKGNPDMIIQVLFNLVGNANRHTKSDTIEICASREGTMVLFNVRDNGIGIPHELMEKIFERGISGDGGTGLGLHICKETVEAHGGTITVDNIPGGGANITFTLPIYNNDASVDSDTDSTDSSDMSKEELT